MNQEEDKKYPMFIGLLLFFAFMGIYFVYGLLFGGFYSGIFGSFFTEAPEKQTEIENIDLKEDIFANDQFKEMELSERYNFDINNIVVGKNNPFDASRANGDVRK